MRGGGIYEGGGHIWGAYYEGGGAYMRGGGMVNIWHHA